MRAAISRQRACGARRRNSSARASARGSGERNGKPVASTMMSRMDASLTASIIPEMVERTVTFLQRVAALPTVLGLFAVMPYCAWQRGTNENTNGLVRPTGLKGPISVL
jgi:hypothetical protein